MLQRGSGFFSGAGAGAGAAAAMELPMEKFTCGLIFTCGLTSCFRSWRTDGNVVAGSGLLVKKCVIRKPAIPAPAITKVGIRRWSVIQYTIAAAIKLLDTPIPRVFIQILFAAFPSSTHLQSRKPARESATSQQFLLSVATRLPGRYIPSGPGTRFCEFSLSMCPTIAFLLLAFRCSR